MQARIYRPGIDKGWGLSVWVEMITELLKTRELIWRMFLRDFTAKYKQTVLGILWAIIMPLVTVATFLFLHRSGILNIGNVSIPYPAYAILGLTIWHIFGGGIVSCTNSIVDKGGMLVKINLPREAFVIISFLQIIVEFFVRLCLVILMFIIYKIVPSWTVIFLPFVLLPLVLFTLGLGLFFSILNVLMRDIGKLVTIVATFLLFLTPVLYSSPKGGIFSTITKFNPVSTLISAARDIILTGRITEPNEFIFVSILSLFIFILCWRIFHFAEMRVMESIGLR